MSKTFEFILRILFIIAILPALQSNLHAQVDGNVYTYDAAGNRTARTLTHNVHLKRSYSVETNSLIGENNVSIFPNPPLPDPRS